MPKPATISRPAVKPSGQKSAPWRNLGTYSNVIHTEELHGILLTAGEMNFVDKSAYPQLVNMEQATVQFLLENMHGGPESSGFATTGSSEAIILALAWHQQNFVRQHPKVTRPNFIVNRGHHKVFEKYAALFGAEIRTASLGEDLRVDPKAVEANIDEATFCIVGVAGSTELGMVDDIERLNNIAMRHNIPMHIDAAIGGYVLPFTEDAPIWDFLLPAVQTINISAHKYGMCLPGVGFLLVRDSKVVPDHYNGEITYLAGGGVVDHALSCSRNAAFVVNAYHNVVRIGRDGYRKAAKQNVQNSGFLAQELRKIAQITRVVQGDMPVVIFSGQAIDALSRHLAAYGWIQSPHIIASLGDKYIRVVMRKHITRGTLATFVEDIRDFYDNN